MYLLKVANLAGDEADVVVTVDGLPGVRVAGPDRLRVPANRLASLQLTVSAADEGERGARPVRITVARTDDATAAAFADSRFLLP